MCFIRSKIVPAKYWIGQKKHVIVFSVCPSISQYPYWVVTTKSSRTKLFCFSGCGSCGEKKRTIPTCSILNFQWLPRMLTGDIHHQWIGFFGKVVSPESLIFFMGKPGWENRFSDSLILNGKIDGFRFSDSPIARPIHWNHWRQKQVAENVWPLVHNEKLTSLEKFQVAWQDGVS